MLEKMNCMEIGNMPYDKFLLKRGLRLNVETGGMIKYKTSIKKENDIFIVYNCDVRIPILNAETFLYILKNTEKKTNYRLFE